MCHDLDLPIPNLTYRDRVTEIADTVVHLYLVMQEFLKGGDIEDLVRGGLRGIDDELHILIDLAFLLLSPQ